MPHLVLERIRHNASRQYLRMRYTLTRNNCCVCGLYLSSPYQEPLGDYFTMDLRGRFYCRDCDKKFTHDDDRIYHKK